MNISSLEPALFGFILSFVITFFLAQFLPFFNLPKVKDFHKKFPRDVQTSGGVTIALSFTIVLGFLAPNYKILIASLMVMLVTVVSYYDDKFGVDRKLRVLLSLFVSLPTAYFKGEVYNNYLEDFLGIELSIIFGYIFVILIFMFFVNSVNLTGGYDGTVTSLHSVLLFFLVLATIEFGNPKGLLPLLILMGGLIAFFIFEKPPAKLFLGNSGTHIIGIGTALGFFISELHPFMLILMIPHLIEFCFYWYYTLFTGWKNRIALAKYDINLEALVPQRDVIESIYHAFLVYFKCRDENFLLTYVLTSYILFSSTIYILIRVAFNE